MNLADALVPRSYTNGELIIKQGESADGMYFVEDGQIQITIMGENGREVEVKYLNNLMFQEIMDSNVII